VTADALSGSSVDDLTAAASVAGLVCWAADWVVSSRNGGGGAAGSAGAAPVCGASDGVGDADEAGEAGDGVPVVPALSGLFSLMTVGRAPFTRTNEYALIIRQRSKPGKPAHNYSHCCEARHKRSFR
jgi:hypothetical protein